MYRSLKKLNYIGLQRRYSIMAMFKVYDAIVIGSGQGGTPLATALANSGRKTALVESEHVGGTCVNEGCTPTKTMVASGRVAYLSRRAEEYGIKAASPPAIDMVTVRKRKRDIVNSFRGGSEGRLKSLKNLDLIMGTATFTGAKELEVTLVEGGSKEHIKAETIFINTGGRPTPLAIPGVEQVEVLDSTSIMEIGQVPDHLVVIGGGYVGLEFAQMFRRFGSRVTVVQRGERLLNREDKDVADAVFEVLEQDGLEILLNTTTKSVSKSENGQTKLIVESKGIQKEIDCSHLLVAAGRTPNTDVLNPTASNVKLDRRGFVTVNDKLETSVPGIYALGDVKGGPAFTHISYDDFRVIRTNFLEDGNASIKDREVAYTVYIDPQLGRVGLTEEEAQQQGRKVRIAKMPMSWVARAIETDESRGFMKALVDPETNEILGCAILGLEGGEIMSMLHIAMLGKVPYTTLKDAPFAHPTLAESLNNLFGALSD